MDNVERATKSGFIFTHLSIKCRRFPRTNPLLKVNGEWSSANIQVTVQAIGVGTSVLINAGDSSNYQLITQQKSKVLGLLVILIIVIYLKVTVYRPCVLTYFRLLITGSHVKLSSCHSVQHHIPSCYHAVSRLSEFFRLHVHTWTQKFLAPPITVGGDLGGRDSEPWTYFLCYLMALHQLQGLCNVELSVRKKVNCKMDGLQPWHKQRPSEFVNKWHNCLFIRTLIYLKPDYVNGPCLNPNVFESIFLTVSQETFGHSRDRDLDY